MSRSIQKVQFDADRHNRWSIKVVGGKVTIVNKGKKDIITTNTILEPATSANGIHVTRPPELIKEWVTMELTLKGSGVQARNNYLLETKKKRQDNERTTKQKQKARKNAIYGAC